MLVCVPLCVCVCGLVILSSDSAHSRDVTIELVWCLSVAWGIYSQSLTSGQRMYWPCCLRNTTVPWWKVANYQSCVCLSVCVSRGAYTQAESPVAVLMRRGPAVASLPALGPWAPPAEWGPSLESIYRVSLTVDLCEG